VQLPKPELQVEVHRPPLHARLATFVFAQARLQPPQLAVLLSVFVSHPSSAVGTVGWLQLPKPELQVELQTPAAHDRLATFEFEHARVQLPQWSASAPRFTSQPSSAVGAVGWLQFPYGALHVESQTPPLHDRLATFEFEHTRAHCPQLLTLVLTLVSQPSSAVGAVGWVQLPKPELQVELHTPPVHDSDATFVVAQARAQAPQLAVLVFVLVSQPSSAVGAVGWLQLPKPELHVELQVPPLHDRAATLAPEHARLHAPQLSALVLRFTSQPSSAVGAVGWPQLAKPELQVEVHSPPLHARPATFEVEHPRPQLPQLPVLVFRLVSQPSVSLFPLQSPKPVAHVPLHTPPPQVRLGMLSPLHW
jgi:hypothetical protein